jgi:peptidyl-prolyl cis-trans isomerase SurA
MRRICSTFFCLIVFSGSSLLAQTLDKPVATVRLVRTQVISANQLRVQLVPLEARNARALTAEERAQVVDLLIQRALIEQAAERDKIRAAETDITARFNEYRASFAASLNLERDITDAEMQSLLASTGMSWADFQDQVRYEVLRLTYARARKASIIQSVQGPTDADAEDYYNYHKKDFVSDDMVRVKHIFIDTRSISADADLATAKTRAEAILREIAGGALFDEVQMKYSEDTAAKYRGGDLGIIDRLDQKRQQLFGKGFIDSLFSLKKGEMSGVLVSSIGYHIVVVTDKFDSALLGFYQLIPPSFQSTVKDFIKKSLQVQRQDDAFTKAIGEIVTELKAQAEIHIFTDNI